MQTVPTLLVLIIVHVKNELTLLSKKQLISEVPFVQIKVKVSIFHATYCVDIDECSNGNHVCDVNANCASTVGSHNCSGK